MNIEFVPCYSDKALFLRFAKEYVDTLREFDDAIVWDEKVWDGLIWDSRFILEGRTIQGFIVVEEVSYKIYAPLLYIAEFYLVPEARRKGIGTEVIKEAVRGWDGDIFLYVLKDNHAARWFWASIEQRLRWKRIKRPEIREESGCELLVFQKGDCV